MSTSEYRCIDVHGLTTGYKPFKSAFLDQQPTSGGGKNGISTDFCALTALRDIFRVQ